MAAPFSLPASAAARAGDPGQLIQSIAADIASKVKPRTGSEREAAMRQILQQDFDLPYMASRAVGSHWNSATEPQKARFLAAFETTEARAYADRLGGFLSATVLGVTAQASGVWAVDSRLDLAGGQSVNVQWEVRQSAGDLRISDVRVSGVSLFVIKHASYQSYISTHGGEVEPLVQVLEARAGR